MPTNDAIKIGGTWTNLNTLAGVEVGSQLLIQNLGRAGDIIELAISDAQPSESFRGVSIRQIEKLYRITPANTVWVRYIRYDLNGTNQPEAARLCLVSVQSGNEIQEVSAVPSSLLTKNDENMRLRVSSADLVAEIAKGNIPGHRMLYIHGFANNIGQTESLIWPLSRPIVFSDTPSNLYISSSNAADSQLVFVSWLDDQYIENSSVVQLTGQTPVLIGFGLRVNNAFTVSTPGTLGDVYLTNENNHVAGVPVNLDSVIAYYGFKLQSSSGVVYTVPAGHTAFGLSGYFSASKGKDYDFLWNVRNPVQGLPSINTNVLSVYENTVEVNFQYTSIPQRTDAYFTAVTDGAAGKVSVRIPAIVVDNNFL